MASDPDLLEAFRRQVQHLKDNGAPPSLALLAWLDQPGVDHDDLIDVIKDAGTL